MYVIYLREKIIVNRMFLILILLRGISYDSDTGRETR